MTIRHFDAKSNRKQQFSLQEWHIKIGISNVLVKQQQSNKLRTGLICVSHFVSDVNLCTTNFTAGAKNRLVCNCLSLLWTRTRLYYTHSHSLFL